MLVSHCFENRLDWDAISVTPEGVNKAGQLKKLYSGEETFKVMRVFIQKYMH